MRARARDSDAIKACSGDDGVLCAPNVSVRRRAAELPMRRSRGINVFSGNMPFLGGRRIATEHGPEYAEWLTERFGGTGDTDYVGYFFHRAKELMSDSGCIGFIATAAITDGDNRRTVLEPLLDADACFEVYSATTAFPWPGINAQVNVSIVHLAKNLPSDAVRRKTLNGREVDAINSRLRSGGEWLSPKPLPENAGLALVGCFLRGDGFILEPDEALAFLEKHPEEVAVVRPFLVGDDLTNSPDQHAERYVIDFQDLSLEEARAYPHALSIVEQRVRPKRERLKAKGADAEHRKYWWRFANVRRELRVHAANTSRFLATARLSKRPVFAFVPSSWTPSEQVVIFPLSTGTACAILQSRVHRAWVSLQATHMGAGLRYSATDCFAPFPFPAPNPAMCLPELDDLGERMHELRREFAQTRGIGLTQTYNVLEDTAEHDPDIDALRRAHEAIDRVVLDAYGWHDLIVPPYCFMPGSVEHEAFEDAVAERLFRLNAERAGAGATAEAATDRRGLRRTKGPPRGGPRKAGLRDGVSTDGAGRTKRG